MASIAEATVAKRIHDHLALGSRGPPLARALAAGAALETPRALALHARRR